MPLTSGTRLGAYEILSAIGAGGMGEVYKARDTKLHRDVAVKVLPDVVAADPERLARFEREAQVLAALNHPNIAQVYGIEDSTSGEILDLSANALSPQGDRLIYAQVSAGTGSDLWVMPIDRSDPDRPKPGQPQPFLKTPLSEVRPAFSHDGRWVAYSSNESGIMQVYVRTFEPSTSGAEGKWRISSVEGAGPIWSRNGRQLFFQSQNRIMVTDFVVRGRSFMASQPRVWSTQPLLATGFTNLDLAPDGRFAVVPAPTTLDRVRMTVLLNFLDELRRRIP